jgi:hypothetical protein
MKTVAGLIRHSLMTSFLLIGVCAGQTDDAALQRLHPAAILPTPPDRNIPPSSDGNVYFGAFVAVEGRTIITGVSSGPNAYVYERRPNGTWRYAAQLPSPDGNVFFGRAAISGDTVLIGALTGSEVGTVYVYKKVHDTWRLVQTLTEPEPEEPTSPAFFGFELAIHGDTAILTNFTDANSRGAAYLYRKTPNGTLRYVRKLRPDDQPSEVFGWSVSIDDHFLAIGAPGAGVTGGAVYLFQRVGDRWRQTQKLTSPLPVPPEPPKGFFGQDVALSGRTLVVADPNAEMVFEPRFKSGAAFVFTHRENGWRLQQRLARPFPNSSGLFGQAVSAAGRHVYVSAWGGTTEPDDPNFEHIYVYERCSGGPWHSDTFMSEGIGTYAFGYFTAASGRFLVTTEPAKPTEDPVFEGQVDVFEIPRCDQ